MRHAEDERLRGERVFTRTIDGQPFWRSKRFWGLVIIFVVNVLGYFGVDMPEGLYFILEALGFTTAAVGAAQARAPLTAGATKIVKEVVPNERGR